MKCAGGAVASPRAARYLEHVNIVDELYAITAALEAAGVAYAVCGGIAVTAYGAPRATQDIDIVIKRDDLVAALQVIVPLGFRLPAGPMVFGEGTPNERHVQRVNKIEGSEHMVLDLLLAEAAYSQVLDDRVTVQLPRGPLSLVSRQTLLKMKRMAGRPKDLIDIERLEKRDDE